MRTGKRFINKIFALLAAAVIAAAGFLAGALLTGTAVYAESGTVYSCTINRCYAHPVTGEIEDSGGESSYATGQGMVEGCVYPDGILEVTDSGNYYLTVRLSLMDYTSGHGFLVQNVGDSGWMETGVAVTGNSTDSNGTTADICIQVPSENCIVRGSMYVEPMGRDVIFFFYPNNYAEGNSTGMSPAFVTEASGSGADSSEYVEQSADTSQSTDAAQTVSAANSTLSVDSSGTDTAAVSPTPTPEADTLDSLSGLQVTPTQAAEDGSATDSELNSAQGLSLSTAEESGEDDGEGGFFDGLDSDTGKLILVLTASFTFSGLILMFFAALIVVHFRKNWRRWGGEDDDDD